MNQELLERERGTTMSEDVNELIAEARQEESIQDKLGDGFSEGSGDRAFYYEHRDRYKRLADALEAATELRAERDAALAAIERVRAEHPVGSTVLNNLICQTCGTPSPCPTVAALDGAPEAATAVPEPNQYAACFVSGNGSLSILGTVNSVQEYAENEMQMIRSNEAAYPDGNPDVIVLGARFVGPWLPVEGETDGRAV